MNKSRWIRVKSLFHEALELPTSERESFVCSRCGDDEGVCEGVLRLVRARRDVMERTASMSVSLADSIAQHVSEDRPFSFHPTPSARGLGADGVERSLPEIGQVVRERYELRRELGTGGFGKVVAAFDRVESREVALKFVAISSEGQKSLYRRELATLRRASVPGVVALLDDGDLGAWAFLVMDLVEGTWFPGADIALGDFRAVLPRAVSLLQAVGRLHAAGVFHRDLKPSNVLVGTDGQVTIVDLGIAEDQSDPERWRSGRPVSGTPPYVAPERFRGVPAEVRSDLYSVGVLLVEALSPARKDDDATDPRVNFKGDDTVDLTETLSPDVPDDVRELLRGMTAARCEARPGSAAEALDALRAHLPESHRIRLPRLGGDAAVNAIVDAATARGAIDVVGRRGSGRTRTLEDASAILRARGHMVLTLTATADGSDPITRLVPLSAAGGSRDASDRDDRARGRLRRWLRDGAVLVADDASELDPATRKELDQLGAHGAVIRALPRTESRQSVEVALLSERDLLPLVAGPDRPFHLREDVAAELWSRTRGSPARLMVELEAWRSAGLCTWDGGLSLEPQALERIRSLGMPAATAADARVTAPLHPTVLDVWDVLSLSGAGLDVEALAHVLERPARRVAESLPDLVNTGVLDVDALGRAFAIVASLRLPGIESDVRMRWSERIAAVLPQRSGTRFRHLVIAERFEEACDAATHVARAALTSGSVSEAREVLDVALAILRRHLPGDTQRHATLIALMVDAVISMATESAIHLARYHVELAPQRDDGVLAWNGILHAASLVLHRDPEAALERLDAIALLPTDDHRRLFHVVANAAANRSHSLQVRRERLAAAHRWVRIRPDRDARSLLAAWTGWLRFEQGAFRAASGLQSRAARLARRRRARATALCNAAAAAIEAGDLEAASERIGAALREARVGRDRVNESRAERILRVLAYRLGKADRVDEALVESAGHLGCSPTRGMIGLGEAAIAWRLGLLARGAALAEQSFGDFPAASSICERALVGALAAACDGRLASETIALLEAHGATLSPIGVAAQAAALLADAVGPSVVPDALRDRACAWARSAQLADYRREVLTPREVLARLNPGINELREQREESYR